MVAREGRRVVGRGGRSVVGRRVVGRGGRRVVGGW